MFDVKTCNCKYMSFIIPIYLKKMDVIFHISFITFRCLGRKLIDYNCLITNTIVISILINILLKLYLVIGKSLLLVSSAKHFFVFVFFCGKLNFIP